MPPNFDWQTEEDERRAQENLWDEPLESERTTATRRRPPWRLIAVVAVLALLAGGVLWWRVNQRIEATLEAFRIDVIASHNLVQRAAADGDTEVFRSLLSGRFPSWTESQMEIFRAGLFVDRAPLGLTPVDGSLPAILPAPDEETPAGERVARIDFSPDLNEATVTADIPYQRDDGQIVTLEQVTVFRRGDSRWLLAPPLDEFWGDWSTSEGKYLTLIYPRRDSRIAERLAIDLNSEIGRMCNTLEDLNCSADLHLTVRLDSDPATLASLGRPLGALQRARERGDIMELPAPTLVGLPAEESEQGEEAAYTALRDGYARHIIGAAIAQAVNWHCCDNPLLFHVMIEYQLGELGIMNWPIGAADYERVLNERLRLSSLSSSLRYRDLSELPEEQLWQLRAGIDFLAQGLPGVSVADMQRTLDRTRNFNQFLSSIVNVANSQSRAVLPNNLNMAWWLYAFSGSLAAEEPAAPLPGEDLYMGCTAVEGIQTVDTSRLLRYGAADQRWTEVYTLPGFIWMSTLADPEAILLQEFMLETQTWRTSIWRDGEATVAYTAGGEGYSISFGESDPSGQKMLGYSLEPEDGRVNGFILDLEDCDGECATRRVAGRPTWSPNGEYALYQGDSLDFPVAVMATGNGRFALIQSAIETRDRPLRLGPGDASPDGADFVAIDNGRAPFWLDERTFGYIRSLPNDGPNRFAGQEIVIATVDNPAPVSVVTPADLYAFLPNSIPERDLSIAYVATHPAQPGRLFIVIFDNRAERAYVFLYDLETRRPELRAQLLYRINHSLSFSPDGRYLVLTGEEYTMTSPGDNSATLLLHDIAVNRTVPLVSRLPFFLPSAVYDWTDDGRWLALVVEDNLLALVAPDDGEVKLLAHSYGACTSLAWLRP